MESNHVVCEYTGLPNFKHLINWKNISFAFSLMYSESLCVSRHKCFLFHDSELFKAVRRNFQINYEIINVFDNDLDAIKARIGFVQAREERSNFLY